MRPYYRFWLQYIVLFVVLALTGCDQKMVRHGFTLESTPPYLSFSADGGTFQVDVAWSNCKIQVETDAAFVRSSVPGIGSTEGEGSVSLTFTVDPNPGYTGREALIRFVTTAPDLEVPLQKEITLTQEGIGTESVSVSVHPDETFQTWDGFGAMNLGANWTLNTDWTEADADALLQEMGLTIMRIRIPADETRWEALAAECLQIYRRYGVRILASPWTMPARMKTPEQTQGKKDGVSSSLKPECYEEYALYLERFAAYMLEQGVPLAGISVQNEPDYAPEYDGCVWSAAQHLAFMRDYGQLITSAPLVTAESFSSRQAFYKPVLEDETACSHFDIVGGHLYGTSPASFDLAAQKGKRLWMTEHLLNDSWTGGTDHWKETLQMLAEIHACIVSGWNAYIWWYGCRYYSLVGDGEEGTIRGKILPRGYAYAQFSRYIRPGDVRIGATVEGSDSLLCCAFRGDDGIRVVLVNKSRTRKEVRLDAGGPVAVVTGTCTAQDTNVSLLATEGGGGAADIRFSLPGESVATVLFSR